MFVSPLLAIALPLAFSPQNLEGVPNIDPFSVYAAGVSGFRSVSASGLTRKARYLIILNKVVAPTSLPAVLEAANGAITRTFYPAAAFMAIATLLSLGIEWKVSHIDGVSQDRHSLIILSSSLSSRHNPLQMARLEEKLTSRIFCK